MQLPRGGIVLNDQRATNAAPYINGHFGWPLGTSQKHETRTFLMKKLIALAIAAAFSAASAHAASQTIEFANSEDGSVQSWTFNSDGTATGPEGTTATYKWDKEAKTLCAEIAADEPQTLCVTFAEVQEAPEVGFVTDYTTDAGTSGKATLVALEADEAGEKSASADEDHAEDKAAN